MGRAGSGLCSNGYQSRRGCMRSAWALAVTVVCQCARADWVATNLAPADSRESRLYAVTVSHQYGVAAFNQPPTYSQASVWSGTAASWSTLSQPGFGADRKSTRLNPRHERIAWI